MKEKSQQPTMDEGLLNTMQGLHDGKEQENSQTSSFDFLNDALFEYALYLHPKKRAYWIERQIKQVMSKSAWPRLLLARCRLLLHTALPLIVERHWELLETILMMLRCTLHYLSLTLHGARLSLNIALLIEPFFARETPLEAFNQQFIYSWFELFNDTNWFLSAFIPVHYIALNCSLLLLELALIAFRGWLEINKLEHLKTMFGNLLKDNTLIYNADELNRASTHLDALLNHTYKKLSLNLGGTLTTTLLFILKHYVIPSISFTIINNPAVPFIFSVAGLVIAITNHYLRQQIDQNKPNWKIDSFSEKPSIMCIKNGFFRASNSLAEVNTESGLCL